MIRFGGSRQKRSGSPLEVHENLLCGLVLDARPQRPIGLDYIFPGAVAQLGERLICIQEVAGSIPTSSTKHLELLQDLSKGVGNRRRGAPNNGPVAQLVRAHPC